MPRRPSDTRTLVIIAARRLVQRGNESPTPREIRAEIIAFLKERPAEAKLRRDHLNKEGNDVDISLGDIRSTKSRILKYSKDSEGENRWGRFFEKQSSAPDLNVYPEDALHGLFESLGGSFVSGEARKLADELGCEPFVGSLLHLIPPRGQFFDYRERDIGIRWVPSDYPQAPVGSFLEIHDSVRSALNPTLRLEIESWLEGRRTQEKANPPNYQKLGANTLRTYLRDFDEPPGDAIGIPQETGIYPLELEIGATDWWCIQGFNNRLYDDAAFRRRASVEGWTRQAVPLMESAEMGRVPSYITCQILVTGQHETAAKPEDRRPYLVLTQRPLKNTRWFPGAWSISIEENWHGPRLEHRGDDYQEADSSLHACARRGLEKELGVRYDDDVRHLKLLGLFIEAPMAVIGAILWAELAISWNILKNRMARAEERNEIKVAASEPLTTDNITGLWYREPYEPVRDDEGRDFYVPTGKAPSGPRAFHPTSRGRLLQYLLADQTRHSPADVIRAFATARQPRSRDVSTRVS